MVLRYLAYIEILNYRDKGEFDNQLSQTWFLEWVRDRPLSLFSERESGSHWTVSQSGYQHFRFLINQQPRSIQHHTS